jgi:hypothetical protein
MAMSNEGGNVVSTGPVDKEEATEPGSQCLSLKISGLWTLHARRVYISTFGANEADAAMVLSGVHNISLRFEFWVSKK